MSNWISKATNAFQGDDESSSQAFELFCDCGQKHSGLRRAKWQRIVCRACGGSLFVLQRDAYPAPKEKPEQRPGRAIVEDEVPVSESLEAEHEETPEELPAPRRESSRPRQLAAVESRPKRPAAPPVVAAPSYTPSTGASGFWKPFRLILVIVALLGGVTGFVLYRSSQRTLAERSLKDSIDKIKDALHRGEWVEARNQLEVAVKSSDLLGRQDADAKRYRQQLHETEALTRLLSQPLSEVLDEAAKAQTAGEPELAAYQYKVKGQWVMLEGLVEPLAVGKKSSRLQYRLALPLSVGSGGLLVEVVIESSEVSRLLAASAAETVVVAIQIDAIQLSADQSTWQIVATPETTVLWTSRQTYLGVGYTKADADLVAATLDKQSKSLGVSYDPEPK